MRVRFIYFLCRRDDSQGALRFVPVCPSVCPSVRHALRYRVQLLPQFLMDLFETLHTCCGHIEDVYVGIGA